MDEGASGKENKLVTALDKLKIRKKGKAPQESTSNSEPQEQQLVEVWKDKKVLQWVCTICNNPCLQIREESRCICGHRLKYHAEPSKSGKRKCQERGCPCKDFFYIVAEGSWVLRCQCKHKAIDHDPNTHACKKPNCKCQKFMSPWVCNCDHPWSAHEQREVVIKVKTFSTVEDDYIREVNPWQDLKRGEQ